MTTIIQFTNVSYTWPGGKGLSGVNISLERGDFAVITGPSGSGKSTLLRLAARLEEPQEGEILFDGKTLAEYAPPVLRQSIGFVQQTPVVVEGTVKDNLLLPFSFSVNCALAIPSDDDLEAHLARFALEGVGLEQAASALSVGQRQRVCIIRSLLVNPSVLLMDEPTSALDPVSRRIVEDVCEQLQQEGVTILMVNHSEYCPVDATCIRVADGKVEVQ